MAEKRIEELMRAGALLSGKRALVTGAAAGLGRAILDGFAAAGGHGLAFDLQPANALPEGWIFEAGDVGAEADVERACRKAAWTFGGLDILVANAGIVPPWRESESVDLAEWDRVFAVNTRGIMATIKHAVPLMKQGGGSIIVVASVNAFSGHPKQAAYTASKHAALGIARAAAGDLGRYGIRVNALAPGPVATGALLKRLADRAAAGGKAVEDTLARYGETPLGRMASAGEVAAAALFLASGLAAGITGQILPVDAGATP
jgi:NAD(P)-dependent dehydrogenase (short-subunit alcohol dehydrogenase family)